MLDSARPAALRKDVRFGQLFGIGFGTMIGVGWMLVAGGWIVTAGPGGAIVAFAIGAAAVLIVGLAYAEMGGAFPFSGGEIVYAFEGLGPKAAFAAGWALTLIWVAVCAFELVAAPWIVATVFPGLKGPVLYSVLGADVTVGALLLGFAGLVALATVNVQGGQLSVSVQNIATACKVAATAAFVVAALAGGSEANRAPWFVRNAAGSAVPAILAVLATVPVWFGGFNTLPQALGEVADLRHIRRLALVLVSAILAGLAFFSLVILATASAAPRDVLQGAEFPVAAALRSAFAGNPWPANLVLLAGLLGLLTSWNASLFAGSRVLLAMGRARLLPAAFARVHPRFGSPAFAVVAIAIACAPIAFAGRNSLNAVLSLIGLAYAICYLFTALSVVRLRARAPALDRPYRMPRWAVPLSALLAAVFIAVAAHGIWAERKAAVPPEFLALAVWVVLGMAVYAAAAPGRAGLTREDQRSLLRAD